MTERLQLLATASTLVSQRKRGPSALDPLRLLTLARTGDAEVKITIPRDRPVVRFQLHEADKGWAENAIRHCAVPSVFCFGPIRFTRHRQVLLLDAPALLASSPENTRAEIVEVGTSEIEWLEIEFGAGDSAWLSPPRVREAIEQMTWAGSPTDQIRRRVHLRCIANPQTIEQPRLGIHPQKHVADVHGVKVVMQATISANSVSQLAGRIRHSGTGMVTPTAQAANLPRGVIIDVDFEVNCPQGDLTFLNGPESYRLAQPAINSWICELIKGRPCQKVMEFQAKSRAEAARAKLEERRKDLQLCDYVKHKRDLVYRVPTNENQLVALFLKLEARGALPFKCQVVEYTPKTGIDAIGHFSLKPDDVLEMYAPIEFEQRFESFIVHGHPAKHTKLIVCWSADDGRGRKLESSTRGEWLKYYSAEGCRIPVIVVKHLPGISTEKQNV